MTLSGLYVSNIDLKASTDGVAKKILMQTEAFRKAGIKIENVQAPKRYSSVFGQKVLSRLPLFPVGEKWTGIDVSNADFLYIRKPVLDVEFYRLIKNAKRHGVKQIVMEIPTFPYDAEMRKRWKSLPYFWKDCFCRKRLSHFVDRLATYSQDDLIFGIPTLKIVNGIDFSKVTERRIAPQKENEIHLLCVANMSFWHGYDRLLYGLSDYYLKEFSAQQKEVFVHLVGEGSETQKYKEITEKQGISQYVQFHGRLSGKQLDEIYDLCDVGICSLGCHRKGIELSSELKTREYASKGIPMVTSCSIDVFPKEECDFVRMIPANERPVSIPSILDWYESLLKKYGSSGILSKEIRSTGKMKCDIFETMKPVIEFIKDEKSNWEQHCRVHKSQ